MDMKWENRFMKKVVVIVMSILVISSMLMGCGNQKLAECFDQTEVENSAKEIIMDITDGEYASVNSMFRKDLRDSVSEEALSAAVEQTMPNAGVFDEFETIAVIGQQYEGEDAAVVVVIARYENQKVQYTMTFDTNMELIGLFMR